MLKKRTVFASITRAPRATPLQFVAKPQFERKRKPGTFYRWIATVQNGLTGKRGSSHLTPDFH